jgi:hypothetical protein
MQKCRKKKLDPNYGVAVCYGCDKIPAACDIIHVEEKDFNEILHQLLEEKKRKKNWKRRKK